MKFFMKANGKRGEVYLYEPIGEGWFGGVTAKSFSDTLRELGKVDALDIYINSPGGSVFDGIAIYNQIKRFSGEKIAHIDGLAASIASVIPMACDEIRIADNGLVMIHDPFGFTMGTADEMRKCAESLDKVRDTILDTYVATTKGDRKQISDWMTEETWFTADEAVKSGFATKKTEAKTVKAEFASSIMNKFNKVPERLRKQSAGAESMLARMSMRAGQLSTGASPRAA